MKIRDGVIVDIQGTVTSLALDTAQSQIFSGVIFNWVERFPGHWGSGSFSANSSKIGFTVCIVLLHDGLQVLQDKRFDHFGEGTLGCPSFFDGSIDVGFDIGLLKVDEVIRHVSELGGTDKVTIELSFNAVDERLVA